MCGGGGKAPEPQPYVSPQEKYKWQAGAFQRQKQSEYQNQAKDYNTELSNYSTQFNNYSNQGNDLFSQVQNLDMGNESAISNYRKQAQKSLGQFNSLANQYSMMERPEFQTHYNGINSGGAYLPVGVTIDAPTLNRGFNSFQLDTMNDGFENALSHLDKLDSDRKSELNRVSNFRDDFRSTLSDMQNNLSGLGIGDMNQVNAFSNALNMEKQRLADFDSPLQNDFSFSNNLIANMESQLGDLNSRYNTEQQRIGDFQNTMNTAAQGWAGTLDGLDMTHGDQINTLHTDINRMIDDANNFNSEATPNFDMTSLMDVRRTVDDLKSAREAELGRINSLESNAMTTADWLNSTAASSQGYSMSGIDAMQKQLDDQRGRLGDFSSTLDYDFADEIAALDSSQLALDELRGRRSNAVDSMFADQSRILSEINAIDLSNESGLKDLQSEIRRLQGQANGYSGGRIADLNTQLGDLYGTSSGKLQELYDYRGDLESQAQELLTANQGIDFLDLNQLSEAESQFNDLNALVSQYGAQSAGDEITQLQNLFNDNRSRLEQDAANVAQANDLAASQIYGSLDSSGNLRSGNLPFSDFLTEEEYLALLQNEEEDESNPFLNPAFSASVGISV